MDASSRRATAPQVSAGTVFAVDRDLWPGDEPVLRRAVDSGARISLQGHSCRGLNLNGMSLSGMDASGSDMGSTTFVGADLSGARFHKATCHTCDFTDADLSHASFTDARAKSATFRGVKAEHLDASDAVLVGSDWTGSDLSHATFSQADIRVVDFARCRIDHAKFNKAEAIGSNFSGATGVFPQFNLSDMRGAFFVKATFMSGPSPRTGTPTPTSSFYGTRLGLCDPTGATGMVMDGTKGFSPFPHPDSADLTDDDLLRMRPLRHPAVADDTKIGRQIREAISFSKDFSGRRGRPASIGVHIDTQE